MDMGEIDDDGMGTMSMGPGIPTLSYMQNSYWVIIGSAIAFATILNILNKVLACQRLSSNSAKPKSAFWLSYATITAICRELSYTSFDSHRWKGFYLSIPPLGKVIVVLSNLIVVLVLCFYGFDTLDQWKWEDIALRCGYIGVAQLPLIFLLAGKDNLIGTLTGFSYERLNWLHRWTARILWLTVTLHMGFWFRSWARYDYIKVKLLTDQMTQQGFAAWCILTFILAISFLPVRRWNYELFVVMHLVTFAGFIGAVYIHVDDGKIFVWIPVGLFFLDRLLRVRRVLYLNLTVLQWRNKKSAGLWANKATLTPLPGNVTRISINDPAVSWRPGQHMFLSCHSLVPLQSHPFTILSLPSDGKMEFLVQAKTGGTKRFFDHASRLQPLPEHEEPALVTRRDVGLEGPYGRIRRLDQFDSVIFFAGSTGATFTLPHLRHLVRNWMRDGDIRATQTRLGFKAHTVTRRIRFVWVIKSRDQLCWIKDQLEQVIKDVTAFRTSSECESFGKEVDISVYLTCDEGLMAEKARPETARRQAIEQHRPVEEVKSGFADESRLKKKPQDDIIEVVSVDSSFSNQGSSSSPDGCSPNGPCCCKKMVEDEEDEEAAPCCCAKPAAQSTASANLTKHAGSYAASEPLPPVDFSVVTPRLGFVTVPAQESAADALPTLSSLEVALPPPTTTLKVVSGRPHPRSIIRKVLDEAEGESAVVVCGPAGLRDDVRHSVVALSDERAVHKGTGAQGVYLHVEGFDY